MTARLGWIALLLFAAAAAFAAAQPQPATASPFPRGISGYRADGKTEPYDRETVYKYMDGGAEIYLEYGMKALLVQHYTKEGAPPIVFGLFDMDSAEGAFGAFSFEREDEGAGVGQESEYGGGLLRFWQGKYFAFIQTERETPASREAVLALGKAVAGSLGPAGVEPGLPAVLKAGGLRPRSVRYIRSPLLLEVLEPQFAGNPLGLPPRCEVVLGRYGAKGSTERAVVARCSHEQAAKAAVQDLLRAWSKASAEPAEPFLRGETWTAAAQTGRWVCIVLGASDRGAAEDRLKALFQAIEEVKP